MNEATATFTTVDQTFSGVNVKAEVFTDGSGLSCNVFVPVKGLGLFHVAGSVGDARKVSLHPFFSSHFPRRLKRSVMARAENAVHELLGCLNHGWHEQNRKLYE